MVPVVGLCYPLCLLRALHVAYHHGDFLGFGLGGAPGEHKKEGNRNSPHLPSLNCITPLLLLCSIIRVIGRVVSAVAGGMGLYILNMAVKKFVLPEIAESVHEAEIGRWLVKEGDYVKKEQVLVEVLTDKVNTELPSPYEGYVRKILAREGDVVTVGTPLVIITDTPDEPLDGEDGGRESAPVEEKVEEKAPVEAVEVAEGGGDGRPLAAPAVRKLARQLGIDLSKVKGTGPGGRIRKVDVLAYAQQAEKEEKPAEVPAEPTVEKPAPAEKVEVIRREALEEIVPIRGIRRKIAEHLRLSKDRAVHTLHVDEIDMTEVVALRKKLKPYAEEMGVKLTYLPIIMKALVPALKKHPFLNAVVDDEQGVIILKKYYNFGVAVDTPDGLIVPVIKNVDRKSIIEIARELADISQRAREGKLELEELQDATFSITNIGSIGGVIAYPVIDYPRVAILGTHRIKKTPVVDDNDEIVIRHMMFVSLTFDHRVLDGAEAARFTRDLAYILEHPEVFILESL